jgi:hypothetical protein
LHSFKAEIFSLETMQTPASLIKIIHLFWNADISFSPTFAFVTAAKLGHANLYKKQTRWIITLMQSDFVHHWQFWTEILFTNEHLSAKLPNHFQMSLSSSYNMQSILGCLNRNSANWCSRWWHRCITTLREIHQT